MTPDWIVLALGIGAVSLAILGTIAYWIYRAKTRDIVPPRDASGRASRAAAERQSAEGLSRGMKPGGGTGFHL